MTTIAAIIQSISVISACWVAIAGINAWRREFVGKRRIELAEEVLQAFFALRDAVASLRNPFQSNEEGRTRKPGAHETEPEAELLNRASVVFERFQAKKDVFARFETLKYRVMAAFGKDTERIFTDTKRTVDEIFVAAHMLGTHYWQRQGRVAMGEEERRKHLEEMRKHQAIFWDMRLPDDPIKRDLEATLSDLERVTAPAFENERSLYGWLKRRLSKNR